MGRIERFEDLDIWQKARDLARAVWSATCKGSFEKDFSLKDQINRSAGSVMDNIAEGFERDGKHELIQFLSYSKASAAELRSQLYRAKDRDHVSTLEFELLMNQAEAVSKMLAGFMNYLKKAQIKGLKYKTSSAVGNNEI